ALQDLHSGHDETRRAETTLDSRLVDKGLLDIAELPVGPHKALQRADVFPVGPGRQVQAGVVALPVNDDIAGTALPYFAALLHTGKAEVVAQHIGEAGAYIHCLLHFSAVD